MNVLISVGFIALGGILGIVYASLFEWVLHKYVMHRPIGKFDYPFRAHAVVHHQTFKADHTYHLVHEPDKKTIPMAWWNGPVLVLISQIPFLIPCFMIGNYWLLLGSFMAFVGYYCAYEYLHWCMHLPKARRVEMSWVFYRLNGHHLLHHRYMHKNFNVVLPLADLLTGTLLLRSSVCFTQATGPRVPNVQPQNPRSKKIKWKERRQRTKHHSSFFELP